MVIGTFPCKHCMAAHSLTLGDLVPGGKAPPSFKCSACSKKTYLPYWPTVIFSMTGLIVGLTTGRLIFQRLESLNSTPLSFSLFAGALLGSFALVMLIYVGLSVGYYKYVRG